MQTPNLECKKCGKQYYSASPKYAAELMTCEGCGSSEIVVIQTKERA